MASQSNSALVWATADLLRGDYKQSDYGKIILPFTLLRRLECVLEPTREAVLAEYEARKNLGVPMELFLTRGGVKKKTSQGSSFLTPLCVYGGVWEAWAE